MYYYYYYYHCYYSVLLPYLTIILHKFHGNSLQILKQMLLVTGIVDITALRDSLTYESGHGTVAVLLPGFAINW